MERHERETDQIHRDLTRLISEQGRRLDGVNEKQDQRIDKLDERTDRLTTRVTVIFSVVAVLWSIFLVIAPALRALIGIQA